MVKPQEGGLDHGITLEIVWLDDDVVEIRVRSSNGRFAAAANCYNDHEVLARLAATLRGFPCTPDDRREFDLGNLDPARAGGRARLRFSAGSTGHAVVQVRIRTGTSETAEFLVPVEPAAIDAFVRDLGTLKVTVGATARLPQAT